MRSLLAAVLLLAACTSSTPATSPGEPAAPSAARPGPDGAVQIRATAEGFEPSRIEVKADQPVKLVFTRTVERTCMTGVVFPDLGIEKDLPLNQPVTVELTPKAGGTVHFQCPMGMGKSTVVTLPNS